MYLASNDQHERLDLKIYFDQILEYIVAYYLDNVLVLLLVLRTLNTDIFDLFGFGKLGYQ